MYQFITASKDATIYLQQPKQNTGLDEILEISKVYYGNLKDTARTLIKFDTSALSASLLSGDVTMSSCDLILKECESNEIPIDYTIYAYAISQSWDMGIGTRFDDISIDGVTWNYRTSDNDWLQNSGSLNPQTTGSLTGKGGVWYTGSYASQSFNYQSSDIDMNILPLVSAWLSGSFVNEGIILKHSSSLENDTLDYGQLKFFSKIMIL